MRPDRPGQWWWSNSCGVDLVTSINDDLSVGHMSLEIKELESFPIFGKWIGEIKMKKCYINDSGIKVHVIAHGAYECECGDVIGESQSWHCGYMMTPKNKSLQASRTRGGFQSQKKDK